MFTPINPLLRGFPMPERRRLRPASRPLEQAIGGAAQKARNFNIRWPEPEPDVDTRFDPDQVDAGSGNTLMEDARLKNPAALKALTDYLQRGGR